MLTHETNSNRSLRATRVRITAKYAYRPRLKPEHLRRLQISKQRTGKSITQIVSEALIFTFDWRKPKINNRWW